MAGFKIELFKGIRPRISALKLTPGEAQTAQNLKLGSGDLEPWFAKNQDAAVANTYYNKSIYLFDAGASNLWFEWDDYVDVARGPVKDDSLERTYYTGVQKGSGAPRMTYTTIADGGGGGPYPEDFRYMGVPAPVNPPLAVANTPPEDLPASDRVIKAIYSDGFTIGKVGYTTYPGTGTDNNAWQVSTGQEAPISFGLSPGNTFTVLRVIDSDNVVLESTETPGLFVKTYSLDAAVLWSYKPMSETGSTKAAQFIGWTIPEARVNITGHSLRVGDVIRLTSVGGNSVLDFEFFLGTGVTVYEQSWPTVESVVEAGVTRYQLRDVRITPAAVEGASEFQIGSQTFTYDVDRTASAVSELDDRQYVYTYVNELGEEGPPSPVSNVIPALNGDSIFISNIPGFSKQGYDITTARLYRTNSTSQGTEFQFVKEFSIAGNFNSVNDTVKSEDLSEVLGTATWFGPDPEMKGIVSLPNGMLAGFKGKTLFFCEPYVPHAWPAEYDQAVDYKIVGLAAFGNAVAVLTDGYPSIASGSHPRNINIRPYKINQACLTKESIATEGDRVYYASPDGLVELSVNGAKIVTQPYAKKEEWEVYSPSKMVGSFHDGKYFGFFDGPDNVTQPPRTCVLSGTVTSASEDAYRTSGETIILTLTGDTWVASGATFNAQRQNIIDALDVTPDTNTVGFNDIIAAITVANVVRTSNTVVTITLTGVATYQIGTLETVTMTVPASALSASAADILATPSFTVTPNSAFSSTVMLFYADNSSGQGYVGRSINDPSGYNQITIDKLNASTSNYFEAGAYSATLDRWVFVGDSTNALGINHEVYVSDNNADTLQFTALQSEIGGMDAVSRSDALGYYWISSSKDKWHYSQDGLTWRQISQQSLSSFGGPVDYVLPSNTGFGGIATNPVAAGGYFWMATAGASTDGGLLRSANINAGLSVADNWEYLAGAFAVAADASFMAAGDGMIMLVSDADGNDLAYMNYGDAAMTTVSGLLPGASTGIIGDLVYGNGIWCGLGSSGSTYIADASSVDATDATAWTRTAAVFNSGLITSGSINLIYDEGSDGTNGYGFCVFFHESDTNEMVMMTSPDAVTWTERIRITALTTEKQWGIAGKNPESNLDAL